MDDDIDDWPNDVMSRIEAGLAIIEADNRERPYRTSDRYYKIFRAVQGAAIEAGNADVIEALGTMPPQAMCGGDYQATNAMVRKVLRTKLNNARDAYLGTIKGPRSYLTAELCSKLCISAKTLNRHCDGAKVKRAARGGREFRFSPTAVRRVCKAFIKGSSSADTIQRAEQLLADLDSK